MSNQKKFSAKGYYIALVLCAAAIGVSGYLYYRNLDKAEADVPAHVLAPVPEVAVPVVARKILMELPIAGADGYNHRSESNAT